jgi:hypothetical protein
MSATLCLGDVYVCAMQDGGAEEGGVLVMFDDHRLYVSMPSYSGDYRGLARALARAAHRPSTRPLDRLCIIAQFGEWWHHQHRDIFEKAVVDFALSQQASHATTTC